MGVAIEEMGNLDTRLGDDRRPPAVRLLDFGNARYRLARERGMPSGHLRCCVSND
jgi:hypothetical protein